MPEPPSTTPASVVIALDPARLGGSSLSAEHTTPTNSSRSEPAAARERVMPDELFSVVADDGVLPGAVPVPLPVLLSLTIKPLAGAALALQIDGSAKVEELQQLVDARTPGGAAGEAAGLVFRGQVLGKGTTLAACGVADGDTLYVLRSL